MTFNITDLEGCSDVVYNSTRRLIHTLQCKPVGTTLLPSRNNAGRLLSNYDVVDVLAEVKVIQQKVSPRRTQLRKDAIVFLITLLEAKLS